MSYTIGPLPSTLAKKSDLFGTHPTLRSTSSGRYYFKIAGKGKEAGLYVSLSLDLEERGTGNGVTHAKLVLRFASNDPKSFSMKERGEGSLDKQAFEVGAFSSIHTLIEAWEKNQVNLMAAEYLTGVCLNEGATPNPGAIDFVVSMCAPCLPQDPNDVVGEKVELDKVTLDFTKLPKGPTKPTLVPDLEEDEEEALDDDENENEDENEDEDEQW